MKGLLPGRLSTTASISEELVCTIIAYMSQSLHIKTEVLFMLSHTVGGHRHRENVFSGIKVVQSPAPAFGEPH